MYLAGKGLQIYRGNGSEITVHCPFCPDGDPKGKGKLYLNTETWLWDCKRCGDRGNRKTLLEFYGDEETVEWQPGADPGARRKLLEEYVDFTVKALEINDEYLLYLLGRGLSAETIVAARLGYHPKGVGVLDSLPTEHKLADKLASGMLAQHESGRTWEFHSGKITIPYLTRSSVLQVRGKEVVGRYFTPSGENVRLYNEDALRDAEIVIITEGEFDALILRQFLKASGDARLQSIAVVALPGAGSWPGGVEGFPEMFRNAKRVYIALDPDDVGERESKKLKEALGVKARIVNLPSEAGKPKCDWTEYLRDHDKVQHPWGGHTWRDIADLLNVADLVGKRVFSLIDAGTQWKKDLTERPGIQLGFPTLDAILKPGINPGSLTIPLAKTGTGKTVFLANIAYNLRHRRVLAITLENTKQELYTIWRRVTRFWHPAYDDYEIQLEQPHLRIVDENRLNSNDFEQLIAEYTEDIGLPPEVVFVDYLGYYARGMKGGSPYEKASNAAMQLKEEAKRHGLAVIAPHQVNRGAKDGQPFTADDARDSGVIEETGDFVLGIFRPGDAIEPGKVTGSLNAELLKSRRGGKGRIINLQMSLASLVIVDRVDHKSVARIDQENAALNRGEHYDDIYKHQRGYALQQRQKQLVLP